MSNTKRTKPSASPQDLRRVLKLRHFHMLDVLDNTRTMRGAADVLGISIAAVSKACIELETLLDGRLFERGGGVLTPTQLCVRLLEVGQRIADDLTLLSPDLCAVQDSLRGTVRIGFQAPALQAHIPRWFAAIKNQHPFLTLTCEYGMRRQMLNELVADRYDILLIDLLGIETWPSLDSQCLHTVLCGIGDGKRKISMPAIMDDWPRYVDRMWLLPLRGMAMRDRFDALLSSRRLPPPERVIEINSPLSSFEIQEQTDALRIVGLETLFSNRPDQTPDVTMPPESLLMAMGVVWARSRAISPSARLVLETIRAPYP
ncbi:LysR family transcriptional regulator [Ameyamaea chiangmaiensis]|nr:LysR family transcriptional regulator [Ameyamaea chiangmaiensis]